MATKYPRVGEPGYAGPIPGAAGRVLETIGGGVDAVTTGWSRTGGAAVGAGQDAVEGVASGLRDVGGAIGGAIGGLFGGGSESNASPAAIAPARPVSQPTSTTMQTMPTAAPRALTLAAPATSGGAGQKQTGKKANKRKKSKGK